MPLDVSALESSLRFWEWIEYGSVIGVILGVAGEYLADFTEFGKRSHGTRLDIGKLSTLVLIGALAVELVAVIRTNSISGQVIEAMRASAETERQNRVSLDKRTANRSLSAEDFRALTRELAPFADQAVEVLIWPVTFETNMAASGIEGALLNAKWRTGGRVIWPTAPPYDSMYQGVFIRSTADEGSRAAAKALFTALRKTGVPPGSDPIPLPNPDRPRVLVFVGDRPTPLSEWVK
jgi:hypothetical protein